MAAPSAPNRPVVLLVDDEQALLGALREGLESEFEIETASSAEEATMMASTRRYDVVVCDQLLPGEQGLEFLVKLAQHQPGARRIMMTGYINPELLSRSISLAKLSQCLIKPVSPQQLAQTIRAVLRG